MFTGSEQRFNVPSWATTIFISACGAQGGEGEGGGRGGYVFAKITIPFKTSVLFVNVGGSANGTFNGAGNRGGGATDIRTRSGGPNGLSNLESRIVVAGGGGAGTADTRRTIVDSRNNNTLIEE